MKKYILFYIMAFVCHNGFAENSNKVFSWEAISDTIFQHILADLTQDNEFQQTTGNFGSDKNNVQFDALEVVFNDDESFIVYAESADIDFIERALSNTKLKTRNKIMKFLVYIDKHDQLPKDMFLYFNYKFYVLYDYPKTAHITYRINPELDVIDKTILLIK